MNEEVSMSSRVNSVNHCKRILSFILCTVLMLCTACGKASNGLMQNASPSTSALGFYVYDGEKVSQSFAFDSHITRNILDKLDAVRAVEAKDWSLADITLPIYGLEIGAKDGWSIFVAWSNGTWITQTGAAYRFDFDFAKLEQDYPWSDKREFSFFSVLPCARLLAQDESGWSSALLTPVSEPNPPDGVSMTLVSWDKDEVTVTIANDSGAEWSYGEHYVLQVLLSGVWYDVPAVPGNWAFNDIAYIILDGGRQDKTYHLGMYGDLPAGTYRLVSSELSVSAAVS